MRRISLAAGLAVALGFHAGAAFADDAACKTVRMSDLGWTDIALTNATAEVLLAALGYEAEQTLLGIDVTYVMLKKGEIDVFQGNWRPLQDRQFKTYFEDGSVEPLETNLEGAKYTLAVPKYVSDAGVRSFADLAAHADKFDRKIYAIEPGTNPQLFDMVAANAHGLGGWEIVESSEAGMLTQVQKAVPGKDWIVFLGWEPHPMNLDYEITYLAGGDAEFGPNFGGATVRTVTRKGYAAQCPNVAQFFRNLAFDLDYENLGMRLIMKDGMSPAEAAREMMKRQPERLDAWLKGVTTMDGQPGLPVAKAAVGI